MADYTVTFSDVLLIPLAQGITGEQTPVSPSGTGWYMSDSFFMKDTSQIAWVWKKAEIPTSISLDDQYVLHEPHSENRYDLHDLGGKDSEEVIMAVRIKPGSDGEINSASFNLLTTSIKDLVGRLYIGDHPTGGTWSDRGLYSQVNIAPDITPPSNRTQVGTILISKQARSEVVFLDAIRVSDENKSIFVTAEAYATNTNATTAMTWRAKNGSV